MWILVDYHSLCGGFPLEAEDAWTRLVGVEAAVDAVEGRAFIPALRHGSVLLQDPHDDVVGLVDAEMR